MCIVRVQVKPLTTEGYTLGRPGPILAAYPPRGSQQFEAAIARVPGHRAGPDAVACVELDGAVGGSAGEAAATARRGGVWESWKRVYDFHNENH